MKYLFVNAIKSDYKIPIKVELRYLNEYNNGLLPYIKDEIIKFTEIAKCDEVVDRMLSAGAFIFFFDGYDEVASAKKESITKDICKMTKKYNSNLYVLTSRPFVNVDMLEGFINYQVCDLCDSEIESFIKKQFDDSEQELADRMIQTINDESSKAYRSFLSNPLLLSMFIVTYQTDSNIPQRRCDYYEQVFNTLYSLHDTSSKLGYVRERKTGLSKENIVEILKRFSFTSYFEQKYSFTLGYFENQLNGLKEDLHLSFSNEDFIEDTEVAIGILTQEGLEITFPHRSLQEYFAALFVTTVSDSNKKMMYEFLFQYFERSCLHSRYDDNSNFFSLLFEMDNDRFKSQLVIPLLYEIKEQKKHLTERESEAQDMVSDIINCFLSLHGVSIYVNSSMNKLFVNEHIKYDNKFKQYIKKNKTKVEERGEIEIIGEPDEYTMSRIELAKKDILLFLNECNIEEIIKEIENDIAESERKDARLIKSMISMERLKTSGADS